MSEHERERRRERGRQGRLRASGRRCWRASTPSRRRSLAERSAAQARARARATSSSSWPSSRAEIAERRRGRRRLRANAEAPAHDRGRRYGQPADHPAGLRPRPRSGNPLQTIVLGVLFGLVLGVGLALLREQADRRLRRPRRSRRPSTRRCLTTVPRNRKLKRNVPFEDLPPEVAEAFRMLQINLRYGRDEPVRTVLVTSARSRRGQDDRGLEPGARRPPRRARRWRSWRPTCGVRALAERYGLEPQPGLAEALRGEVPVAEALQAVSPAPAAPRPMATQRPLHVIVAGQPPHDPWALMQSAAMAADPRDRCSRTTTWWSSTHRRSPTSPTRSRCCASVDGVIVTASVNSTPRPGGRAPARPAARPRRPRPRRRRQRRLGRERLRATPGRRQAPRRTATASARPRSGGASRSRAAAGRPSARVDDVLAAAPAEHVGDGAGQDLRVEPERPVRAVQVVDA